MIPSGKRTAVDTETTGLDGWHGDRVFMISFCNEKGDTGFFDWPVDPFTREVKPKPKELRECMRWFRDASIAKVFFNAKFDIRMLGFHGIETRGPVTEVMFKVRAVFSDLNTYKLKPLAKRFCEYPDDDDVELHKAVIAARRQAKKKGWKIGEKDPINSNAVNRDYWLAPPAIRQRYAVADAERTMLLDIVFNEGLAETDTRETYDREMEVWPIVYEMESRGIMVYPDRIRAGILEQQKQRARYLAELRKLHPEVDNWNSNVQLQRLFYEHYGEKVIRRTSAGNPSVDVHALRAMRSNPVAKKLLHLRAHDGALDTFKRWEHLKTEDDDGLIVIHPNFNQAGSRTGRFSSSNPNAQNIQDAQKTRSEVPIQMRHVFGPRPGFRWYLYDYSQMEVRVLADCAQEPTLLAAIAEGRHIHTETTNRVWGGQSDFALRNAAHALELDGLSERTPKVAELWKGWGITDPRKLSEDEKLMIAAEWLVDEFDGDIVAAESSIDKSLSKMRAKILVFLKVYGGGKKAASEQLGLEIDEAGILLDEFDAAFPRIKEYSYELSDFARRHGYIINRFGRRITVNPDFAYKSVNYMIQGSCADFLKDRMIATNLYLKEHGINGYLLLCVHDEVVFEIERGFCRMPLLRRLARIMGDHGGHFGVPIPVECERALSSWDKKKEIDLALAA